MGNFSGSLCQLKNIFYFGILNIPHNLNYIETGIAIVLSYFRARFLTSGTYWRFGQVLMVVEMVLRATPCIIGCLAASLASPCEMWIACLAQSPAWQPRFCHIWQPGSAIYALSGERGVGRDVNHHWLKATLLEKWIYTHFLNITSYLPNLTNLS